MANKRSSSGPLQDVESFHKKLKLPDSITHLPTGPSLPSTLQSRPPLPQITPSLSSQVFTHESALKDSRFDRVESSYERLELLGDAYIEVMASRLVFTRFPRHTTGQLSQTRESLIKNEQLAVFARAYGFDERVQVGLGTAEKTKTDRRTWIKIMGDVFESYVAAVVLADDVHGWNNAEEWLLGLWEECLPKERPKAVDTSAKQKLAIAIASKGIKIEYKDDGKEVVKGKPTVYTVGAYLTGWGYKAERLGVGKGLSKMEAGQRAATAALENKLTTGLSQTKKDYDLQMKRERKQGETANGKQG